MSPCYLNGGMQLSALCGKHKLNNYSEKQLEKSPYSIQSFFSVLLAQNVFSAVTLKVRKK